MEVARWGLEKSSVWGKQDKKVGGGTTGTGGRALGRWGGEAVHTAVAGISVVESS